MNLTFGTYFNSIRVDKGLTIVELARRSGISMEYISRLESGIRRPSAAILKILASALDVEYAQLLAQAEYLLEEDKPTPDLVSEPMLKQPVQVLTSEKQRLLHLIEELSAESVVKVTTLAEQLLEEQQSLAVPEESVLT